MPGGLPSQPRRGRLPGGLPTEAALAEAWETRGYGRQPLVDDGGRGLRVVFPGRRWGGPGPDFRGAVLALSNGTLLRGDIEVHRRASGWVDHRHAADPAYDGVVLHVVAQADTPTLDRHGQPIATLVLSGNPTRLPDGAVWPLVGSGPCVRTAAAVRQVVEAAGRARFQARVARLEGDLAMVEADQVVWRALAEGLGYTRNTAAFGRLAEAVPWPAAAEAIAWRGPLGLAGLLLGTAGLLGEASLAEAHAFRAFERSRGARQMLSRQAWDRRQQRAANTPAQRCRGLAELAARWTGWTPAVATPSLARLTTPTVSAISPGPSAPGARRAQGGPADQLVAAVAEAAGSRRPRRLWRLVYAPPWIGRGRAQVLVVNVLVPFAAAVGCTEAETLFERLPGEPSNRVLRYMAGLLRSDQVRFRGALLQQGLLHLFGATCATRRCGTCPARGSSWPWHDA